MNLLNILSKKLLLLSILTLLCMVQISHAKNLEKDTYTLGVPGSAHAFIVQQSESKEENSEKETVEEEEEEEPDCD